MGNAGTHLRSAICRTVHPHGCGERIGSKIVLPSIIGSSPRLWGTPPERRQCRHWQRFIPTAVGNAACARYPALYKAVHPHGCGERRLFGWPISNMIGSSPRLWGTRISRPLPSSRHRFIPAAVGNAYERVAESILTSVHPHGCGERPNQVSRKSVVLGSSPRLWGTRSNA